MYWPMATNFCPKGARQPNVCMSVHSTCDPCAEGTYVQAHAAIADTVRTPDMQRQNSPPPPKLACISSCIPSFHTGCSGWVGGGSLPRVDCRAHLARGSVTPLCVAVAPWRCRVIYKDFEEGQGPLPVDGQEVVFQYTVRSLHCHGQRMAAGAGCMPRGGVGGRSLRRFQWATIALLVACAGTKACGCAGACCHARGVAAGSTHAGV